jgi:Type ISP C-terminal specificity domain
VLAARKLGKDDKTPARVRFRALPKGRREVKFQALAALSLDEKDWIDCPADWRAPFLPEFGGKWADFAPLGALFDYGGSGVMPGRTWIIAPDKRTLESRWERLVTEKNADKREQFFHPHEGGDKTSTKASKAGLTGHEFRSHSVASDKEKVITPTRYAFLSFDRQWIIPDNRLINRPNPTLWKVRSDGLPLVSWTGG